MKELSKSYHIGYAYGILNGISLRHDVPEEVREKCRQAVDKYKQESDAWEEPLNDY